MESNISIVMSRVFNVVGFDFVWKLYSQLLCEHIHKKSVNIAKRLDITFVYIIARNSSGHLWCNTRKYALLHRWVEKHALHHRWCINIYFDDSCFVKTRLSRESLFNCGMYQRPYRWGSLASRIEMHCIGGGLSWST